MLFFATADVAKAYFGDQAKRVNPEGAAHYYGVAN